MTEPYVHGYTPTEVQRLHDQARTLEPLLHHDTGYPPDTRVLEAGCGVGAQTIALAKRSPGALLTSIDLAEESLVHARELVRREHLTGVEILRADLLDPPFPPESFDHIFVCFVLEHLADPAAALDALLTRLRPGGTLTVIEGDHGSALFHPASKAALEAIESLCELQRRAGGNARIGRALFPILEARGLQDITVSPRLVYADASHPSLVDGFVRKTFTAMVAGVRQRAIGAGLMTPERFDQGVRDLECTAARDGSFCYTFFKAWGKKPGSMLDT